MTANNFAELADLDVLKGFGKLLMLSLMENPVTRKEVWDPLYLMQYGKRVRGDRRSTDGLITVIALSPLDNMAMPERPILRF